MALTTSERLMVDGVDLKTLAKNLPKDSLGATLVTPGRRGSNVATAGRHGTVWTPGKTFEENKFTFPLWVRGTDDDGKIPTGSAARREFYKRVDELMALFTKSHALLTIVHVLPDGTSREIQAECSEAINWTVVGPNPLGRVDFGLIAPVPFWRATADTTPSILAATPTTFAAGATAPLDDASLTIVGPITNPRITDPVSGAWVQYGVALSASQTVTLNAATWTVTSTGSASTALSNLTFSGTYGRLMRFAPDPVTRGYRASLTGTQTTSATRLNITGRAKFLNG